MVAGKAAGSTFTRARTPVGENWNLELEHSGILGWIFGNLARDSRTAFPRSGGAGYPERYARKAATVPNLELAIFIVIEIDSNIDFNSPLSGLNSHLSLNSQLSLNFHLSVLSSQALILNS